MSKKSQTTAKKQSSKIWISIKNGIVTVGRHIGKFIALIISLILKGVVWIIKHIRMVALTAAILILVGYIGLGYGPYGVPLFIGKMLDKQINPSFSKVKVGDKVTSDYIKSYIKWRAATDNLDTPLLTFKTDFVLQRFLLTENKKISGTKSKSQANTKQTTTLTIKSIRILWTPKDKKILVKGACGIKYPGSLTWLMATTLKFHTTDVSYLELTPFTNVNSYIPSTDVSYFHYLPPLTHIQCYFYDGKGITPIKLSNYDFLHSPIPGAIYYQYVKNGSNRAKSFMNTLTDFLSSHLTHTVFIAIVASIIIWLLGLNMSSLPLVIWGLLTFPFYILLANSGYHPFNGSFNNTFFFTMSMYTVAFFIYNKAKSVIGSLVAYSIGLGLLYGMINANNSSFTSAVISFFVALIISLLLAKFFAKIWIKYYEPNIKHAAGAEISGKILAIIIVIVLYILTVINMWIDAGTPDRYALCSTSAIAPAILAILIWSMLWGSYEIIDIKHLLRLSQPAAPAPQPTTTSRRRRRSSQSQPSVQPAPSSTPSQSTQPAAQPQTSAATATSAVPPSSQQSPSQQQQSTIQTKEDPIDQLTTPLDDEDCSDVVIGQPLALRMFEEKWTYAGNGTIPKLFVLVGPQGTGKATFAKFCMPVLTDKSKYIKITDADLAQPDKVIPNIDKDSVVLLEATKDNAREIAQFALQLQKEKPDVVIAILTEVGEEKCRHLSGSVDTQRSRWEEETKTQKIWTETFGEDFVEKASFIPFRQLTPQHVREIIKSVIQRAIDNFYNIVGAGSTRITFDSNIYEVIFQEFYDEKRHNIQEVYSKIRDYILLPLANMIKETNNGHSPQSANFYLDTTSYTWIVEIDGKVLHRIPLPKYFQYKILGKVSSSPFKELLKKYADQRAAEAFQDRLKNIFQNKERVNLLTVTYPESSDIRVMIRKGLEHLFGQNVFYLDINDLEFEKQLEDMLKILEELSWKVIVLENVQNNIRNKNELFCSKIKPLLHHDHWLIVTTIPLPNNQYPSTLRARQSELNRSMIRLLKKETEDIDPFDKLIPVSKIPKLKLPDNLDIQRWSVFIDLIRQAEKLNGTETELNSWSLEERQKAEQIIKKQLSSINSAFAYKDFCIIPYPTISSSVEYIIKILYLLTEKYYKKAIPPRKKGVSEEEAKKILSRYATLTFRKLLEGGSISGIPRFNIEEISKGYDHIKAMAKKIWNVAKDATLKYLNKK